MILAAAAAGYVLGTKAGRERYEQIRRAARKVGNDPRVQAKAHQAADLAKEKAPVVKDKLTETANAAATKVKSAGSSGPGGAGDQLNPDSTHFQKDPYPQGDLP
jgi:hypothetical protein